MRARRRSGVTSPLILTVLSLAVLVAVVDSPRPAFACSCVRPPPPIEARDQAGAVFRGLVDRAEAEGLWIEARIHVTEVWKGEVRDVVTVRTASQGAACGYGFEVGRPVLVYASLDGEGRLTTNLCARTTPISAAQEDLEALGPGNPPLPGTTVAAEGTAWLAPAVGAGAAVFLIGLGAWAIRRCGRT